MTRHFVLARRHPQTKVTEYARSGSYYCSWDSDLYGAAEFAKVGTCKALVTRNRDNWETRWGQNPVIRYDYFVVEVEKLLQATGNEVAI